MILMARRLLRVASIGMATGAVVGLVLGAIYVWNGMLEVLSPGSLSGLVVAWGVVVWVISAAVARLGWWTWRASFVAAGRTLAIAGVVGLYWAVQAVGHDFSPWTSLAIGAVSLLVLGTTAVAWLLHLAGHNTH